MHLIYLLLIHAQDGFNLARFDFAVNVIADGNHRCQSATAQTTDNFKRKFSVRGYALGFEPILFLEHSEYVLAAFHVACRSQTDLDYMPAFRLHREETVECDYAMQLGQGYLQVPGNSFEDCGRKIADDALCLLQDTDWCTGLTTGIIDDALDPLEGFASETSPGVSGGCWG